MQRVPVLLAPSVPAGVIRTVESVILSRPGPALSDSTLKSRVLWLFFSSERVRAVLKPHVERDGGGKIAEEIACGKKHAGR